MFLFVFKNDAKSAILFFLISLNTDALCLKQELKEGNMCVRYVYKLVKS